VRWRKLQKGIGFSKIRLGSQAFDSLHPLQSLIINSLTVSDAVKVSKCEKVGNILSIFAYDPSLTHIRNPFLT
jgi:hypothetical protein